MEKHRGNRHPHRSFQQTKNPILSPINWGHYVLFFPGQPGNKALISLRFLVAVRPCRDCAERRILTDDSGCSYGSLMWRPVRIHRRVPAGLSANTAALLYSFVHRAPEKPGLVLADRAAPAAASHSGSREETAPRPSPICASASRSPRSIARLKRRCGWRTRRASASARSVYIVDRGRSITDGCRRRQLPHVLQGHGQSGQP